MAPTVASLEQITEAKVELFTRTVIVEFLMPTLMSGDDAQAKVMSTKFINIVTAKSRGRGDLSLDNVGVAALNDLEDSCCCIQAAWVVCLKIRAPRRCG
jgi:hypothetical protein